ncbi:MAG TPA: UDP-N-acetylmuramoyl-tripeptide--D-alanyl-D-alanine ligase [Vicinamibacterales bacterium]|nr:UDP-N-acetylmuramoyl-tripeptide--D-alanyl-D-alanine ligase [Vicinamibacterales bacterium]
MTTAVAAVVLTAGMVATATGGRVIAGDPVRGFAGVSIDSRTIAPGALFVALRGDRFDGHAFVGAAVERGAAGVLVSAPAPGAGPAAVIVVDDTLRALQALGRTVRRQSGARVVAITGSAGKTTTKEVAADLLSAKYAVFRNRGNLNNHVGLPLSLTELTHGQEIAVVELGMNHAGEIRALVAIAEPDVRVWTNVGDAHIGFFGSREAIADAKAEILEQATPRTLVVANADDALVMARVGQFAGRRVTFGESAGADVRATGVVDRGFDGTAADVSTPAGRLHLTVPLPGRRQLSNVLAAVGVALEFDVPVSEIERRVRTLQPVARRGAITRLPSGARLVDDSYNASPAAMQAMLDALAVTETSGRRVAVLGEMLELGGAAPALHEACGRHAARAGVDEIVVVGGPAADGLAIGAAREGLAASQIHRFADSAAAADAVARLVRPGDLVLVKGSRGTRTDLIVDRLKEGA